jgi:hypothetical protein
VDALDRIRITHLDAVPQSAIHAVLHFRITALHRFEVEIGVRRPTFDARSTAAADADPICRTSNTDDVHADLRRPFGKRRFRHEAQARRVEHGLEILDALSIDYLPERSTETVDEWLSDLVAVIGDTVAPLDEDRERTCEGIVQLVTAALFAWDDVSRDMQVAGRVASLAERYERTATDREVVADAAAATGGRALEWLPERGRLSEFFNLLLRVDQRTRPELYLANNQYNDD